jgi:hypothetical protein
LYTRRLDSVDGKNYLGFNSSGQVVFGAYDDVTQPVVVIGDNTEIKPQTLNVPISPKGNGTYIDIIRSDYYKNTAVGWINGKVGIRVYRNDKLYYEKYRVISTLIGNYNPGVVTLVAGDSPSNPWKLINKNSGDVIIDHATPLSTGSIVKTVIAPI